MRFRSPIATVVALIAVTATGCSAASTSGRASFAGNPGSSASKNASGAANDAVPTCVTEPSRTPRAAPHVSARPVHASLLESDGGVYGVGMPIIAWFDRAPTSAAAFEKAVTVTVNGSDAGGVWYWEASGHQGAAVEAHYRPAHYWPAHASIRMNAPVKGLSAGRGLAFDDSLTLAMSTGAANIATVDGNAERMIVTSDGKRVFDFPVSLGAADHPTYRGTKIVMEKDRVQEMKSSPGEPFYDLNVPWSVRLTNSGEFAHSASWNGGNIGVRSTSHGCTNLNVAAAKQYYTFAQIGDVFTYTDTGGPVMPSWDGYGDWNVPWIAWRAGGLLS